MPLCRLRSSWALCPHHRGLRRAAGHLALAGEPALPGMAHMRGFPHRAPVGAHGRPLFPGVSTNPRHPLAFKSQARLPPRLTVGGGPCVPPPPSSSQDPGSGQKRGQRLTRLIAWPVPGSAFHLSPLIIGSATLWPQSQHPGVPADAPPPCLAGPEVPPQGRPDLPCGLGAGTTPSSPQPSGQLRWACTPRTPWTACKCSPWRPS